MKVILIKDIKGLGGRLDVKEVRDGYARNFLLPRNLAEIATKEALARKQIAERQLQTDINQYQAMADKLKTERLEFSVKTGDKNEVFESVSADKIQKTLEGKKYKNSEVILPQSLKALGEHLVEVKFPQGIKGGLTVVLRPKQS